MYKNNATLGVGKLDYIVASGTKQKNIQDVFNLEKYLHLDEISPMQTSYTQAPEDRNDGVDEDGKDQQSSDSSSKSETPGIEPSGDDDHEDKDDGTSSTKDNTNADGTKA